MWLLRMHPVGAEHDAWDAVAWAETKAELEAFVDGEQVEPYLVGEEYRYFRKDGPLEKYDVPMPFNVYVDAYADIGTLATWLEKTEEDWHKLRSSLKGV